MGQGSQWLAVSSKLDTCGLSVALSGSQLVQNSTPVLLLRFMDCCGARLSAVKDIYDDLEVCEIDSKIDTCRLWLLTWVLGVQLFNASVFS